MPPGPPDNRRPPGLPGLPPKRQLEARNRPTHHQDPLNGLCASERFDEMRIPGAKSLAHALPPVMEGNDDQVLGQGAFSPATSPMKKKVIALAGKLSIPLPELPWIRSTRNRHPANPIRARSSLPAACL